MTPILRAVVLRALVSSTFVVFQSQDVPAASDSTVDMTASDETFAFSPDKVVARVGQLETIELKSAGGVHGVVSPDFGIETTLVRPDHPVKLAFTPKAPGAYVVHCASVCGVGHYGMAFTVACSRETLCARA